LGEGIVDGPWNKYKSNTETVDGPWNKYKSPSGDSTPQGESGDDHIGGMSRVSALDYWIKNPAKAAGKAYVNDAKDIGNALTHPLDTAVGMVKSIPKNWGDVGNAIKGIPDMVSNHPIQTALALAPGAEGAVGLAEKGVGAAKTVMTDIGNKNLENNIFGLYNSSIGTKAKNLGELNKVKPQKMEALKTMSDNMKNVKLESGEEVPKNRWDLAQTLKQTKAAIYEQYNKLSLDASEGGAEIDMRPVVKKAYEDTIKKLGEDTLKANPQLLNAIKQEAMNELKIGKTNPTRAQVHMQSLNDDVKASYNSGNAVHYSVIDFKRSLLNHLNEATETSIEDALNKSGYGALRDKYAALKSTEKEILGAANKYLKQQGGQGGGIAHPLVNLWSIEEGMQAAGHAMTGNLPAAGASLFRSAAIKTASKIADFLKNPDNKIPKMFKLLEKYEGKKTNIGGEVNTTTEEVSPHRTPPNPVNAELVDNRPKGIGVDKSIKRSDRLLPSDAKRGTGPVIKQGGPGQTKIVQEKRLALPRPVQVKGEGFTLNDPPKHKIVSEKEAGRNPMDEDSKGAFLSQRDINRDKAISEASKETQKEMRMNASKFLKGIKGKISNVYGKKGHYLYEEYAELKKEMKGLFGEGGMAPDDLASEAINLHPEYFPEIRPDEVRGEDLIRAIDIAKRFRKGII
jgi:hypothetical protein